MCVCEGGCGRDFEGLGVSKAASECVGVRGSAEECEGVNWSCVSVEACGFKQAHAGARVISKVCYELRRHMPSMR